MRSGPMPLMLLREAEGASEIHFPRTGDACFARKTFGLGGWCWSGCWISESEDPPPPPPPPP